MCGTGRGAITTFVFAFVSFVLLCVLGIKEDMAMRRMLNNWRGSTGICFVPCGIPTPKQLDQLELEAIRKRKRDDDGLQVAFVILIRLKLRAVGEIRRVRPPRLVRGLGFCPEGVRWEDRCFDVSTCYFRIFQLFRPRRSRHGPLCLCVPVQPAKIGTRPQAKPKTKTAFYVSSLVDLEFSVV